MKRLIPLFIGVLLIVALVFVNKGISKNAQPDKDDDDSQTQAAQKTDTPKAAPVAPAAPGSELQPEVTIGDPSKAKYKITVGWVYDEKAMANPQSLAAALQTLIGLAQASAGKISVEIVDLDVPTGELSPTAASVTGQGVSLNGKPIGPGVNPGEAGLTADVLGRTISPLISR